MVRPSTYGVYFSRAALRNGLEQLHDEHFLPDDVSILRPEEVAALIQMGVPESQAKQFEQEVEDGGILVSVRCDDAEWNDRANEILLLTGAIDVASSWEWTIDSAGLA